MATPPLSEEAKAYRDGVATPEQVNILLEGHRYVVDKYVAILLGTIVSTQGKNFLKDESVRVFAYSFRRGGNVRRTLQWVVDQCRRFSKEELYSEVVRTVLECLREMGYARELPSRLAKNLAQLIGDDLLTESFKGDDYGKQARQCATTDGELPPPCRAEHIYDERGIVLTLRERELLRYLSESFNISLAARRMKLSRQRVSNLFARLKKKARLT